MQQKKPILQAKEIGKSFYSPKKVEIVTNLNFELFPGEVIAITGRSGQGKTTLLHLLGTLEKPCQGTLEIANTLVSPWNRSTIRNQHISFVFQAFHLLDDLTALENVLMPAKISRKNTQKGTEAYRYATTLLEKMGLKERIHFSTKMLSGGEKQRVAIARALCNSPDIILADEPSGNLDKFNAEQIHSLLLSFAREENKSVVFVTHDPALAKMCDKEYQLHEGKLHAV